MATAGWNARATTIANDDQSRKLHIPPGPDALPVRRCGSGALPAATIHRNRAEVV